MIPIRRNASVRLVTLAAWPFLARSQSLIRMQIFVRAVPMAPDEGEIGAARRDLARALEIFERLGTLHEPEQVRRELAALPTSA